MTTGPRDWPAAALRMTQLAIQRRELAWVSRDESGGWRHRYLRGGTLVTPQPRKASWRLFDAATRDIFFHDYTPKPGDVVVELGAGCGTETVTIAPMIEPGGVMVACEAHPWTASLLRRTVEANRLDNVRVVEAAVTDRSGTVTITDNDDDTNIRNMIAEPGHGIDVRGLTLDDLMAEQGLGQIDFLKVNIEGAEGPMLDGMVKAVEMVEHAAISCHDFGAPILNDDSLRTRERVRAYFEAHGFTVTQRPDDPRRWVKDYLYVRRSG